MVRKLYLVRHGEAEEQSQDLKDFDRPLMRIGLQHAAHVGNYLSQQGIQVGLMLSSTAVRAQETAETIADHLKMDYGRIQFSGELYEASIRILLKSVNEIPTEHAAALLVSHNPSITYLAEYLSGAAIGNMVPAGIAAITFESIEWNEVSQNTGTLDYYRTAADLEVQ